MFMKAGICNDVHRQYIFPHSDMLLLFFVEYYYTILLLELAVATYGYHITTQLNYILYTDRQLNRLYFLGGYDQVYNKGYITLLRHLFFQARITISI